MQLVLDWRRRWNGAKVHGPSVTQFASIISPGHIKPFTRFSITLYQQVVPIRCHGNDDQLITQTSHFSSQLSTLPLPPSKVSIHIFKVSRCLSPVLCSPSLSFLFFIFVLLHLLFFKFSSPAFSKLLTLLHIHLWFNCSHCGHCQAVCLVVFDWHVGRQLLLKFGLLKQYLL